MASDDYLQICGRTWRTPLTGRLSRHGSARLAQMHYRGTYNAEGLKGHQYMRIDGWLPVTMLQLRDGRYGKGWVTSMVDDPLHWLGMKATVSHLPAGRIVCAGLGLGLMLHHMAADRPDITEIRVIERNPDVIDLILPTLPEDPRVTILEADFYQYITIYPTPDGVLWDLAVGDGLSPEVQRDFIVATANVAAFWPEAKMLMFGDRKWLRG